MYTRVHVSSDKGERKDAARARGRRETGKSYGKRREGRRALAALQREGEVRTRPDEEWRGGEDREVRKEREDGRYIERKKGRKKEDNGG